MFAAINFACESWEFGDGRGGEEGEGEGKRERERKEWKSKREGLALYQPC